MKPAIQIKNLSRTYLSYKKQTGLLASVKGFWNRDHEIKQALKNVTLEINSGEIVGLVGANGAGKTTLIKVLSGLIPKSDGYVHVLDFDPFLRKDEFLRQISVLLGQKNQLWWDISPLDSYQLLMTIYDLDKNKSQKIINDLSGLLNCRSVLNTQLRRLSLGERMKMELIGALLHQPKLLFLDEPTIGLDIVAQNSIRQFLSDYARSYHPTILLTSHYMDDISKLANRLLVISQGQLHFDGKIDEFSNQSLQKKKIRFSFESTLSNDVLLHSGCTLIKNQPEYILEIGPDQLSSVISELSRIGIFKTFQTEETDFEESIRQFLHNEAQ